jgi:predicted membrane-bound spermidine synthase
MTSLVLHTLFFVSGAAGLTYEVIWVRQFGTVFGSTVYGVALVTAIFMSGLGLGGWAAGRFADARFREDARSPLRWYGLAELAIAAAALALALGLPRLAPLAADIARYAPDAAGFERLSAWGSFARYAIAALLLAPITLVMGATLTLLIRYAVGREVGAAGWRISLLYAANTAGAALGCLLTDTLLVPALGLLRTQGLAVALNLLAGAGALALARYARPPRAPAPEAQAPEADREARVPGASRWSPAAAFTGLALALTGFASMGMQVLWFRHLVAVHSGFRPAFSLLLFVILTGIWLGSLLGSACDRRLRRPLWLFAALVALFVVSTLGSLAAFDAHDVMVYSHALLVTRPPSSDVGWALATRWTLLRPALLLVGLPILFLGAAFPLANAYVQRIAASVGRRAGALYLANTAGAVAGSLAAGFLLLPALGTQRAIGVVVGAALLAVLALQLAQWSERGASLRGSAVFAACFGLPLLALVAWARLPADFLIRRSLTHLAQSADGRIGAPGVEAQRLLALREGVNETIAVMEAPDLSRALFTNGHPMSSNHPDAQRYMRAFAHVPLLLHERPVRAMVMCFGVGNTLHATLLHPLERVDVVDLSADVLAHAHWFEATNHAALDDPRARVFVNDARQHLRMMPPESYDLITGEPPPITQAGVVSLYSREFFALARSRLRPNGLISYWLPVRQASPDVVLALVRGFVEVFPDSVLLSGSGSELILLGSVGEAPRLDPARLRARLAERPAVASDLRLVRLDRPQEWFGLFVASADTMRKASAGSAALSDDRPLLEYADASYSRHFVLPVGLFDVSDADSWCPSCLAPRSAPPDDAPETYAVHRDLMRRLYAHPHFTTHRASVHVRLPVPEGEAALAEVRRSLFLRGLLGLGPEEHRRARGLLRAGRLAEGIRLLEDVALLMPGDGGVRLDLARAYLRAGRIAEGCRALAHAAALAPNEPRRQLDDARCRSAGIAAD